MFLFNNFIYQSRELDELEQIFKKVARRTGGDKPAKAVRKLTDFKLFFEIPKLLRNRDQGPRLW